MDFNSINHAKEYVDSQNDMLVSLERVVKSQEKYIEHLKQQIVVHNDMLNVKQNVIDMLNETIDKMVIDQSIERTAEEAAAKYWFN